MTYRIRVKLGETTVNHLQQHFNMVKTVAAIFAKPKDSAGGIKVNDLAPETAANKLNDFFGSMNG